MQVITYSLREGAKGSDQYYRDVSAYTDQVVAEGESRFSHLMPTFKSFLSETGREAPRTHPEYYYELLTLGVLWRVYANAALDLGELPRRVLTRLARLREEGERIKPAVDRVRGVLETAIMPGRDRSDLVPILTIANFDRLLGWLSATAVFNEEVKRLTNWRDFMIAESPTQVSSHSKDLDAYATWFETSSLGMLGRYTRRVDSFLDEAERIYRWRADRILCQRARVEYHLNMVGTEILNRAFRAQFLRTSRKAVLVPPCMRFQPEERCQAQPTAIGARCAHCTPQCRVHQITKLGDKYGFQVLILPDELSVFSARPAGPADAGNIGLVGVSCVLTNTSGGWETQVMRVPAQGVPLDYCGCRWHWHKEGIPTDVNLRQLLQVLGISRRYLAGANA
jgi:hypothetical protein